MIRVGVIGCGYWGPNLVRNFSESERARLVMVCDLNESSLAQIRGRYPAVGTTTDVDSLLSRSDIDAVAIATPVSTHSDLAMRALRAGKHVLVEKPMAENADQCKRMIDEAADRGKLLMVDYTFPYTGAVKKIRELVANRELGELYYYDSVRVNLGLFQHDVNVIWDLAVHDLSIIDNIFSDSPVAVSSTGISHVAGKPQNIAYLTLFFASKLIAHVHVNWLAPVKIRQTLIGGSEKMIVYNDLEPIEKVKVYDKGIIVDDSNSIYQMRVGYRTGDMWSPKLDPTEALSTLVAHFAECIEEGKEPMTSAESGLRVVEIMEAATDSMENRGKLIELKVDG